MYLTQLALKQAWRYGLQSALAILGVAIGVANIITLISITDLGRRQTTELINGMGANLLIVSPFIDVEDGPFGEFNMAVMSGQLPSAALTAVEGVPEIVEVGGVLILPGHVESEHESCYTALMGVTPSVARQFGHQLGSGEYPSAEQVEQADRVVTLGATIHRTLFDSKPCLGETLTIRGEELRVIGVMAPKGKVGMEDLDNRVFVPLSTLQQLTGFDGLTGLFVTFDEEAGEESALVGVKAALATLLEPGDVAEETFSVFTVHEAQRLASKTLGIFRAVLAGVASIALFVAGIGIMNVMLIRVMQRRQEIGVRMAVGATPQAITAQFVIESVVQALIGALLGVGLGYAAVIAYCQYTGWIPWVGAGTVSLAIVFSALVGILFGAYPAWRASKVDPIESLRAPS